MFDLRYYQQEACAAAKKAWESHRSTAVIMPTASGKSEVYLSSAVEEPLRSLVLVHRDHLIQSPVARLAAKGFRDVAVEKERSHSEVGLYRNKVVFASVYSIGPNKQKHRLERFRPNDFGLLVIDEGHRAVSQIYRNVIDYFTSRNPRLKVLILTATPKRADGVALGAVCESVAYEMTPARAAAEGWICPPRFFARDVPEIDFSGVKLKGQDFDPDEVSQRITAEGPLHKVCASLAEDPVPTVAFCPRVAAAQAYADLLNRSYCPGRAMVIHQDSDDDDRRRATEGLADGSIRYVLNVDVFTEGFDVPDLARVAWLGATASLGRWTQGCGRVFRVHSSVARLLKGGPGDAPARRQLIAESPKPVGQVVTYHPSNCRHRICAASDVLGGSDLPPAAQKFLPGLERDSARREGGCDPAADRELALALARLQEEGRKRLADIRARATVIDREYDGLGGKAARLADANQDPAFRATASWGTGNEASKGQVGWLIRQGLSRLVAETFTRQRAYVVGRLVDAGVPIGKAAGMSKGHAMREMHDRGLEGQRG